MYIHIYIYIDAVPGRVLNNGGYWDVNGPVADEPGREAGVPGHGAVNRVLREESAEDCVGFRVNPNHSLPPPLPPSSLSFSLSIYTIYH